MRILFISTFSDPIVLGGAERTLRVIVEGMRERGHDVQVVSLQSDVIPDDASMPAHTSRFPVRNIYTPDGKTAHRFFDKMIWHGIDLYNPVAARDLKKEFEAFNPDVVSCHNLSGWSISSWNVATRYKVPIVQVLHDYYLMCISGMRSRGDVSCQETCLRCKAFRFPHKRKSASVSAVVGISEHILGQFLSAGYFRGAEIRQIYNVANAITLEVEHLKYPETQVFGFIGRIAPHKGIETLLSAFNVADLPAKSVLLIAGEGEPGYVADLKFRFEDDNIRFLGRQTPDVFFPQLSWSVVPSISDEPLGRVVFESHGYGVPVLGSRRGGIPEMIEDGQNGYLFDAGNESELRALIERVCSGVHAAPRPQIVQSAATFFDTDRFLDQYEDVYQSVSSCRVL